MNNSGMLFGLLIIVVGFVTLLPTLDKEPDELIPMRAGALVKASFVRSFGIILMLLGSFILLLSVLS